MLWINKRLTLTITIFIILSSMGPVHANISWSDDFSDNNIDGWEIYSYETETPSFDSGTLIRGNSGFTAAEGILKATDTTDDRLTFTHIQHNNEIAYGTWSFDWIVSNDKISYDVIQFIYTDIESNYNWTGLRQRHFNFTGYALRMVSYETNFVSEDSPGMTLLKYRNVGDDYTYLTNTPGFTTDINLEGTYHIDITRDTTGKFKVYVNSILKIEYEDNEYSTSEKFGFTSYHGKSAIDNIEIHDEVIGIEEINPNNADSDDSSFPVLFGIVALVVPVILRKLNNN